MKFEQPPHNEENEGIEDVIGNGFVLKRRTSKSSGHSSEFRLEFRPGESTEEKIKAKEKKEKMESERTKDFTPEDWFIEHFNKMLKNDDSYSETLVIKSDGSFDKTKRFDGSIPFLAIMPGPKSIDTATKLYQLAQDVQEKYPEYQFSFKTDSEGKWMKYTVSKNESE